MQSVVIDLSKANQPPGFWDALISRLPTIQDIEFVNGEAWLSYDHWQFLSHAVEKGFSKSIALRYKTNYPVLPWGQKKSQSWDYFSRLDITFNIEDVDQTGHFGTTWEEVVDGIHWAKDIDIPHMYTTLCIAVNAENVKNLERMLDWADTKRFDRVMFNVDTGVGPLNIRNMKSADKESVLNDLKTNFWKANLYHKEIDNLIQIIEGTLESLNSK